MDERSGASGGVALYTGLGAGLVGVAGLVAAVLLYRRSHSEYQVDSIDSSTLAGGFQTFSFKTNTQGVSLCLEPGPGADIVAISYQYY